MARVTVGVDAGGTSTVAAIAQDGRTLRTVEGEAANASVRGVERAAETIAETIVRVLDGALPNAIAVGAAGAGRDEVAYGIEQALSARFSGARVRVCDDASIALRAVVPDGDAAVLIAGTGSIAYAEARGETYRAGGYGYLVGDDGSGFSIGAASIKLLLRAFDERVPRDAFVEEVARILEARSAADVLAHVYGSAHPVAAVAALAPAALDAANRGERSANKIVQTASLELAELTKSLLKRAGLSHTGAPLVFAGGLLRRNSLLTFLLETRLQNDFPHVPILKDDVEPYAGALAAAERLL